MKIPPYQLLYFFLLPLSLFPKLSFSFIIPPYPLLNISRQDSSSSIMALGNIDEGATKVGFIGFGTIASAIANGILLNSPKTKIAISERSISKSKALKEKFPDVVTVYKDNSKIVEESDVIYLCVLPQQAQTVLQELKFDKSRHQLISLVSTATLEDLSRDSQLPDSNVAKFICLPAIARLQGVALYCSSKPPDDDALFIPGKILYCKDEDQLSASMITTCTMGPFYGLLRQQREWLIQKGGLSKGDASNLVIQQHIAMLQDALKDDDATILDDLIQEQTPGGLNEQSLANWEKLGGLSSYNRVMDSVLERIQGESDGSL